MKISGKAIPGAGRGKKMGFRTANISFRGNLHGVYAVRVKINKKTYNGVANIGYAPTFGRRQKMLEVHIFNFNKNIIGKKIKVELVKKLRSEKKFASTAALKKQIRKDVKKAKSILR